MLINIASGLTGKYLLGRSRKRLEATRTRLRAQGLSAEALDEQTYWDSLTFDVVKAWRVVHLPITLAFGVLALATSSRSSSSGGGTNAPLGPLVDRRQSVRV